MNWARTITIGTLCLTLAFFALLGSCQYKNHLVAQTMRETKDPIAASCAWMMREASQMSAADAVICVEKTK